MKRFTWRVVLSCGNVVAAVILFVLGNQRHHPIVDIPTPEKISYMVSMPARAVFANLTHFSPGFGYQSRYGEPGFYTLIFLFWWCIGWTLDSKAKLRQRPPIAIVGSVFATGMSLLLLYAGVTGLMGGFPYGNAIPISMIVWGAVLLSYVAKQFLALGRGRLQYPAPLRT